MSIREKLSQLLKRKRDRGGQSFYAHFKMADTKRDRLVTAVELRMVPWKTRINQSNKKSLIP